MHNVGDSIDINFGPLALRVLETEAERSIHRYFNDFTQTFCYFHNPLPIILRTACVIALADQSIITLDWMLSLETLRPLIWDPVLLGATLDC